MCNIPDVHYKENIKNALGLEVVSFEDLQTILEKPLDHDPFKDHRLKFNVLLAIGKGKKGVHRIDFKNHVIEEFSVVLISKDQVHSFVDFPASSKGFVLMFTDQLFLEIGADYPFLINHFFNNQLYDPMHHMREHDFFDLQSVLVKMKTKMDDKRKSVRIEVVRAYFKILLLEIFACREKKYEKIQKSPETKYFLEFQQLLKDHYVKEKKVKYYSDQLNITAKRLNAITQSVVNQTAKNFIVSHIILEAKKMLVVSNLSTKELAYQIGFDEPTNFTKFFKTHTGMLPSEFVKSIFS